MEQNFAFISNVSSIITLFIAILSLLFFFC